MGHTLGALYAADDGTADSNRQAGLFELGLSGALAGLSGLDDFDVSGRNVDVANSGGVS